MLFRYLHFVRFCLVNTVAIALLAAAYLQGWLDEPDVKLVVVEFYADWCEPCRKAAPKWEKLRKRYASQGLKLVVVNLSEKPGGGRHCTRLPWNPDESLCDPGLGKRLGVKTLPEAFVWSQQSRPTDESSAHPVAPSPPVSTPKQHPPYALRFWDSPEGHRGVRLSPWDARARDRRPTRSAAPR